MFSLETDAGSRISGTRRPALELSSAYLFKAEDVPDRPTTTFSTLSYARSSNQSGRIPSHDTAKSFRKMGGRRARIRSSLCMNDIRMKALMVRTNPGNRGSPGDFSSSETVGNITGILENINGSRILILYRPPGKGKGGQCCFHEVSATHNRAGLGSYNNVE